MGTRVRRTRNQAHDPSSVPISGDYDEFAGEAEMDGSRGEGMRRSELIQLLREIESESSRRPGGLRERGRGRGRGREAYLEERQLGEESTLEQDISGPSGDVEFALNPNASGNVCAF